VRRGEEKSREGIETCLRLISNTRPRLVAARRKAEKALKLDDPLERDLTAGVAARRKAEKALKHV